MVAFYFVGAAMNLIFFVLVEIPTPRISETKPGTRRERFLRSLDVSGASEWRRVRMKRLKSRENLRRPSDKPSLDHAQGD